MAIAKLQRDAAEIRPLPGVRERRPPSPAVMGYALSVACVLAAAALRLALEPHLGKEAPLLLFTLAVLLPAWYGGASAGFLAIFLSLAIGRFLFIEPRYEITIPDPSECWRLAVFAVLGGTTTVFARHNRRVSATLQQQKSEASAAREQLRRVLESTSDAIFSLDRQWHFLYLNSLAREQISNGRDLVGASLWDAFPELDHSRFGQEFRRAMDERMPTALTDYYPPLQSWFEVRAYPSEPGLAVYFRNISERMAAEQRMLSILESLHDGLVELDPDSRMTYVNGAAERLIGVPRKKLLGNTFWNASPREMAATIEPAHREAKQTQAATTVEFHDEGSSRWFEIKVHPAPTGSVTVFFHDVTERKNAESALFVSEKRFRSTFENAAIGMAHIGMNGEWLRVNNRLCTILAYTREELLERTFQDITHPEDLQADLDQFSRLKLGEIATYSMEKRCFRKGGHIVWVNLRVSLERDNNGAPLYCISAIQDITERKHAEMALKSLNEDLRQLGYATSHDLQEPLRMVISFTQLLQRRYGAVLDSRAQQYIEYAITGARRMEALLRGLRDYWSASEHKADSAEPVDVKETVSEAVLNLESLITESDAVVTGGDLPVVLVERMALLQIFQNLIANGIKYRHPARQARVHVSALRENGHWKFSVTDNGVGIPKQYHAQVFGLFKRLHSFGESGTGIGLSLCQKIVERRGGRIWIESSSDNGTTFSFTLPADSFKPTG